MQAKPLAAAHTRPPLSLNYHYKIIIILLLFPPFVSPFTLTLTLLLLLRRRLLSFSHFFGIVSQTFADGSPYDQASFDLVQSLHYFASNRPSSVCSFNVYRHLRSFAVDSIIIITIIVICGAFINRKLFLIYHLIYRSLLSFSFHF